jgi:hypothetical protein
MVFKLVGSSSAWKTSPSDVEAALAHGRIAGRLVFLETVDQHAVQAHGAGAIRRLVPAHEARGGAHAVPIGRGAGDIGRQLAAPLDHDAEAAEREYFERYRRCRADAFDLLDRQHARQYGAADAEAFVHVGERRGRGRRSLYRQMPRQLRMGARGVVQHRHVGGDDGVGTERGGVVHSGEPVRDPGAVRIGVERDVDLAAARMGVADAIAQFGFAEVQPGEGARIGLVAEADIDRIGPVFDGGFQCRQVAGGADQLHRVSTDAEDAHAARSPVVASLIQVSRCGLVRAGVVATLRASNPTRARPCDAPFLAWPGPDAVAPFAFAQDGHEAHAHGTMTHARRGRSARRRRRTAGPWTRRSRPAWARSATAVESLGHHEMGHLDKKQV